jgi:hypothetical protein
VDKFCVFLKIACASVIDTEVNDYIIAFEYYIIHFVSCSVLESAMHVCNFWAEEMGTKVE